MKKTFSVILVLAMLISLSAGLAITASADTMSDPWDGSTTTAVLETAQDGSAGSGYYLVGTGAELAWIAAQTNNESNDFQYKTVVLTDNIDLSNLEWTPIGTGSGYFAGTFDGNGKTISGLYISNNVNTNEGLFGYVNGGTVESLTVSGVISVTSAGQRRAGGIAGYFNNGTLTNCVNDVAISVLISSSDNLEHDFGGVAGYVYNSTVQGCSNTGTITVNTYGSPYNYTGGVIGYAANSNIYDCENSGNVSMTSDYFSGEVYAGGIAGRVANQTCARSCLNSGAVYVYAHTVLYAGGIFAVVNAGCELYNCLNTGSILVEGPEVLASGAYFAGGVVGFFAGYSGTAENCVNTGSVTNPASNYTGGVIGNSSGTTTSIGYCYWGGNCTQTTVCGTAESEPYECYAFDGSLDFGTDDSVTLGGNSYTDALAALRAWVNTENAQAGDIIYRAWTGTSSSDIAFGTAVNVSYNLTNVSKTGNDFAVENEDYETTLSTQTGYPSDVSVMIDTNGDGSFLDEAALVAGLSTYSYVEGALAVFAGAVTGDILITASSTETLYYDVNTDLTGVSVASGQVGENAAVSAQQYSVTLAADDGYILSDDVTVTVNAGGDSGLETLISGADYSFSSDTGVLTVYADSVTGDMIITASGIAVYDVDVSGLIDITASDNTGENAAIAGEDYTITLTAVFPKSVPEEIIVWVDTNGNGTQDEGEVLPDTNYSWTDVLGGELAISGGYVTGDIYITAQAVTDLPQLVVIGGVVLYSTDTESNPINDLVDNDGNSVYTLDCDTAFTVDDFTGSGTAVYDSATALTLNGVSVPFTYLSGVHYYIDDYDYGYDYYLDGDGLFAGGGNLTLALNGDNVFGVAGTDNTVDDFYISGGAVAVMDGTDAGTGSLTIYGYTSEADCVYGLNASRDIYFEDVNYHFIGDAADAEYCYGIYGESNFYMYSGSIDVDITGGSYGGEGVSARSFYMYGGSIDISGTSSSMVFGINAENAVNISDGEIKVSLATTEDGYGVCAWNGITITGGSVNIEMENLTVSAQRDMVQAAGISTNFTQTGIYSGGDLIISGGTVSTVAHGNYARGIYMDGEGTGNVMISGGMVSATGDAYAISANSVTYDGENDILSKTTPGILAAATAEGAVSDLSTVIFDGKDGMYYDDEWNAITYVKIGTASASTGGVAPYYYTVTAQAGAGGSITPNSKSATKFTLVPFIITPNEGYAVASLTVGGAAVSLTGLTDNGDGTFGYSLKVTGDTAVKVIFKANEPTGTAYEGYSDRNAWSWASGDIAFVIENGLMGSTDADGMTFGAWEGVTRGMTVTILYRMAGSPALTAGDYATYNAQFADVASGAWYYDAVVWATINNVTEGISDTMFAPDQDVSREQLVTLLFRFAESMGYDVGLSDELGSYTDADEIDTWAVNSFSWAVAADIVNGTSESTLSPISGATRGELATIIAGFITAFMAEGNWVTI